MDELKYLQKTELDILTQILHIFEKNQIEYYILGGTLLGAVRHNGFIPWDDDIDIGIPRPDYDKFLKIAEQELQSPYELELFMNGKGKYYYARVVNKSVKLLRTKGQKPEIISAWVDVFPLDSGPNNDYLFRAWNQAINITKKLYNYSQFSYFMKKKPDEGEVWPLRRKVLQVLFSELKLEKCLSTTFLCLVLDWLLKLYGFENSDYIYNTMGFWGRKERFHKTVYGSGTLYKFENLLLNGPEDYDTVLTQMYGDYMTPPANPSLTHHYIELL